MKANAQPKTERTHRAKRLVPKEQEAFTFEAPDGATLVYRQPRAEAPRPPSLQEAAKETARETAERNARIDKYEGQTARALVARCAALPEYSAFSPAQRSDVALRARAALRGIVATSGDSLNRMAAQIVADVARAASPKPPQTAPKKRGKKGGDEPPKIPANAPIRVTRSGRLPSEEGSLTMGSNESPIQPLTPSATDILNEAMGRVSVIQRAAHARPSSVSDDARRLADALATLHAALCEGGALPIHWTKKTRRV